MTADICQSLALGLNILPNIKKLNFRGGFFKKRRSDEGCITNAKRNFAGHSLINTFHFFMMQTLHQFQEGFERYLEEQLIPNTPVELYDPVKYIMGLGGKRIRPTILLLSYFLYDEEFKKAFPAAFAIELFHNFTLIHDDVMDVAPLRRGMPTVHEKFGINSAILSGDVMLVLAYKYFLKMEQTTWIPEALSVFTQTAKEVCEGQQMDMNFEQKKEVTIEEYLKMIELKTSVLVAASMKIGALLAGACVKDANHLYEFGRKLGVAFQLQDDYLDAFGDPEKFGKKVGGDIVQNKKTFLFLKALDIADRTSKQQLLNAYFNQSLNEQNKVQTVLAIFKNLEIGKYTQELKEHYLRSALEELDLISATKEKKVIMKNFGLALLNRST